MLRRLARVGLLAVLALIGGVACATLNEVGSGRVVSQTRPVSGFSQVAISGVGTLEIQQGEAESLRIEAEDNILPRIRSQVQDERLTIGLETPGVSAVSPTKPIRYYLTVRTLTAVTVSGAAMVEATAVHADHLTVTLSGAGSARFDRLVADELGATLSGAGNFTGDGTAGRQVVKISGAGQYLAEGLQSRDASLDVSGTGRATVRVDEKLQVAISGAGGVDYIGDPVLETQLSGAGKVTRRPDAWWTKDDA